MKLFFGKISSKIDPNQLEEGYYSAPQDSSWFNGIELGDYAYVIGGDLIQLWKAKEWTKRQEPEGERLLFDIIIKDLGIKIKDFVAFKYFQLSIDFIVKTSRSTGSEQKAFFEINYDATCSESLLLNKNTYKDIDNYRKIRTVTSENNPEIFPYDLRIQLINNELLLHPVQNCQIELLHKVKNNLGYIGNGQPRKDRTLSIIKAHLGENSELQNKISIIDIYDAILNDYKVDTRAEKYWVLNGFDREKIHFDLDQNSFVMYFQYEVQKKGEVTKQLRKAKRINHGDKVILYNKNRYYAHATFRETKNIVPSSEITLQDQIENKINNEEGQLITYTDAPCFYEDLRTDNGFDGEWGQRLNIGKWMNIHENGIAISGISEKLAKSTIITDTILELKDGSFFELVKAHLSGEIKNFNKNQKMKSVRKLLESKKQVILQGPPGTGKTHTAKDIAEEMIFGSVSDDKTEQIRNLESTGQFELIQFHPSYSYEDFVRGITATTNDEGQISYETENKILVKFAGNATRNNLQIPLTELDDISVKYQEYILEKIERASSNHRSYHFNNDDFVRLLDIHKWQNEDSLGKLRYERLIDGNWVMQTWLDIEETFTWDNYNKPQDFTGAYDHQGLTSVQNDFIAFVDRLKRTSSSYVMIIDEINRANLPSVLGELIYALEYRGEPVQSMYNIKGDNSIILPDNLYIIGTMNTADRSVGHIDYAIKRRFAFVDVLPNIQVIKNEKAKELFKLVSALFVKEDNSSSDHLASDFESKDVQLGHSYFLLNDGSEDDQTEELKMRLNYEILPILNEYVKDGILLESAREQLKEISGFGN